MYTMLHYTHTTHIHTLCFDAIVDCTHVGPAIASFKGLVTVAKDASFKDLVTVAKDASSNQTLQAPLDVVIISKEWKVHQQNSRTEHALPWVLITSLQFFYSLDHSCGRAFEQ